MVKTAAPVVGLLLLLLTVVAVPVIVVIAVIYNSLFAIFFPSISSGDSIQNVLSAYVSEFNEGITIERGFRIHTTLGNDYKERHYLLHADCHRKIHYSIEDDELALLEQQGL